MLQVHLASGLSGTARSQKQSGLKDCKCFKEKHCGQRWRWMDGLPDKSTEGKSGVRILPRGIDKLTLKAVGLWSNPQLDWKFDEWKLKGTTANKNEPFQWMPLLLFHVLQSCSIINHYRCHLHLLTACWGKRVVVHSVQKLSHNKPSLTMELSVTDSLTDWCQAAFSPAACWQFQPEE